MTGATPISERFGFMAWGRAGGCALLAALLLGAASGIPADTTKPANSPHADSFLLKRAEQGDTPAQRRYAWTLLSSLVEGGGEQAPLFSGWHSELDTFSQSGADDPAPFPGVPASTRGDMSQHGHALHGAPLMTFIHYNDPAHQHIRTHQLYDESTLQWLRRNGPPDPEVAGLKMIPRLPEEAAVVMTAWWPVKGEGATPLPVWDPDKAVRIRGSNGYLSWPRVVALQAESTDAAERASRRLSFAGRTVPHPGAVVLDRFYHLAVDGSLANRLMADPSFRKASIIALGRPLQAGDFIALVGFHLMTASLPSGTWSTFWWHDEPQTGPFAANRPAELSAPWDNYLMDVTFDARLPLEPDGSANICFNPWFDATFPDQGEGNGLKANCVSCHSRASYPLTEPLRVTRGYPDATTDPALAPGRLRTDFLWSIANTEERLPATGQE